MLHRTKRYSRKFFDNTSGATCVMTKGMKTIANDLQYHPGKRFAGAPSIFTTCHVLAALLCVGGPNAPCADGDSSAKPLSDNMGRVGLAYGGRLPQFDFQIPDSRGDTSGEEAAKKGLSWVRDLKAN